MSENKKNPVERVLTLTLTLQEAWQALGYKKVDSDYLDGDSHDDVFHNGYTAKEALQFDHWLDGRFEGTHLLFPLSVAKAMEDADRQSIADQVGDSRRDAIKDAFEKISVPGEYRGVDDEGNHIQVSVPAKITGVEIDVPDNKVKVTIENPEHLLNDIINGMGYFYPHEIVATEALGESELKSYFLAQIGNYFDVYGESKPDPTRGRIEANPTKAAFTDLLKGEIEDVLSDDDLTDGIITAVERDQLSMEKAVAMAAVITERTAAEIKDLVKNELQSRKKGSLAAYDDMLAELGE